VKTVMVRVSGVPCPQSNGFRVEVVDAWTQGGLWHVDTGVELALLADMTLELEPLAPVLIVSWSLAGLRAEPPKREELPKGRLVVAVSQPVKIGDELARVWIVERRVERVRFAQRDDSGARIVRGEPKIAQGGYDG
jgi:hypothetical protein